MAAVEQSIAPTKNELVNKVMAKVSALENQRQLRLPPNYSAQNALLGAYLNLQTVKDRNDKPALLVCTQESIGNALLDMVVQGLNVLKKQGYFIVYGNQLTFQRSYFGTVAVTKRVTGCKQPVAECIYEGDTFEYEIRNGSKIVMKHIQSLKNIDKTKIAGAYCTIVPAEGEPFTEIMTMEQIKQAWMQSKQAPIDDKGNVKPGTVHGKFTDEMAQKTVTGRACKMFINSSDDSSLDVVVEHMNRSDDAAEEAAFEEEVGQRANGEVLEAEYVEKPEEEHTAEEGQTDAQEEPLHEESVTEHEPDPAPTQVKTTTQPAQTQQRRKPSYA